MNNERRGHRSECPIACTLDLVGDRWSLLIIRDLEFGLETFQQLLGSPEGIATNILATRLAQLTAAGLVDKRPDPGDARRQIYRLTAKGRAFGKVLASVAEWGLQNVKGTRAFRQSKRMRSGRKSG